MEQAKANRVKGIYIILGGLDGVGKSTLARELALNLQRDGYPEALLLDDFLKKEDNGFDRKDLLDARKAVMDEIHRDYYTEPKDETHIHLTYCQLETFNDQIARRLVDAGKIVVKDKEPRNYDFLFEHAYGVKVDPSWRKDLLTPDAGVLVHADLPIRRKRIGSSPKRSRYDDITLENHDLYSALYEQIPHDIKVDNTIETVDCNVRLIRRCLESKGLISQTPKFKDRV